MLFIHIQTKESAKIKSNQLLKSTATEPVINGKKQTNKHANNMLRMAIKKCMYVKHVNQNYRCTFTHGDFIIMNMKQYLQTECKAM